MKIYVPCTKVEHGGAVRGIEELNLEECRMLGGCIESRGTIYGTTAYSEREGVWLYWNKEDWKAEKYRVDISRR